MLSVDQALDQLLSLARPLTETRTLPLTTAHGHYLASDVVSPIAVPGFDNSAMDGYALNVADFSAPPASFTLTQRIAAGETGVMLQAGEAARIFTGAPIPPGANAVAMQEDCNVNEGRVSVSAPLSASQNIRRTGDDIQLNTVAVAQGTRLGAAQLGLLASIGVAEVDVTRPVRVALLSTGSELVEPGQPLGAGQIYNSNRYLLAAMLREAGCEVTDAGIVTDRLDATQLALQSAANEHDIVITTGGVSVGEEDHVKAAVEALGTLNLWKMAIKPGKPFAQGRITRADGTEADFIGLPGNPVSSFVTFFVLVRPFLARRQGKTDAQLPPQILIPAGFQRQAGARREFLRVRIVDGQLVPFGNQGSGVLTSVAASDGLAIVPENQPVNRGDKLVFLPYELRG
ncbi:molybdopterin molybdotransferase MoeA [Silvimonas iriomotensis]|uniref:Molybdopterin molybdenumtransferase n=1 Tax=Silvimonas iriomotensis TaxID=449662 RepID=A0ABQ2PCQ8_9NEIS|nr:gephyrin-like molybdotransferase Glp [Silvimonas iriomotensis]GGP23035.1 molybdopterin molybdenumtransferase MoeA [Silvimonas iriomotensis]